jgi:hypothetical protein
MKKNLLIIFCTTILMGAAQESPFLTNFKYDISGNYKYFYYENCKEHDFNESYLDSIFLYSTYNVLEDQKLIFQMKNIETLYCNYNDDYLKILKDKIFTENPLQFPATIKNLYVEGPIPLPLPFKFNSNLSKLYFLEIAISKDQKSRTNDSLNLDFSYLDSLKEFELIISNWYSLPYKIKVIFPPNIISFYGVINNQFYPPIFPKTIEHINISFEDTIPEDFFEIQNLKTLSIDNSIPLSNKFLKFKNIHKLRITHLTKNDIEIISLMSNLDTLVCTLDVPLTVTFNVHLDVPTNIKKLKVKCIALEVENYDTYPYIKELAINIKHQLPDIKIFLFLNERDTYEIIK